MSATLIFEAISDQRRRVVAAIRDPSMPGLRQATEASSLDVAELAPVGPGLWRHKMCHSFLDMDLAIKRRPPLKSEGFGGWFPSAEKRVAPPEGQEAMEVQKAEEAEEAEEDPLSQALQDAGDSVSSDAAKQLKGMKEKASQSLEAGQAENATETEKVEEEESLAPPDADSEHGEAQQSMLGSMWDMFIVYLKVKFFFMLCGLIVAPCVLMTIANGKKGSEEAEPGEDESEAAYDPRAPPAKGTGKGSVEED